MKITKLLSTLIALSSASGFLYAAGDNGSVLTDTAKQFGLNGKIETGAIKVPEETETVYDYKNITAIPEDPPAVKQVNSVPASVLPLPDDDMDRESMLEAFNTTLSYWNGRPDSASITIASDTYKAPVLRKTALRMIELIKENMSPEDLREAIRKEFKIYRASADGSDKTTLTGYYEAEIQAVKEKDATHIYPIYARPSDLIKTSSSQGVDFDYGHYVNGELVRYFSTEEIHSGAMDGQGLEIAWSEHPAQLMLLHIQGSGIVRYPDGDYIRVGFDGTNGHPFKSVQSALITSGETKPMSFKKFIDYLMSQPQAREAELVEINPRYVFMRAKAKNEMPNGAIGKPLTGGRSIAVDKQYIPYGLIGLVSSTKPVADSEGNLTFEKFTRFISSHDTGSAIRGPGRLDLFWGSGEKAETEASAMKAEGELYLFVLK